MREALGTWLTAAVPGARWRSVCDWEQGELWLGLPQLQNQRAARPGGVANQPSWPRARTGLDSSGDLGIRFPLKDHWRKATQKWCSAAAGLLSHCPAAGRGAQGHGTLGTACPAAGSS